MCNACLNDQIWLDLPEQPTFEINDLAYVNYPGETSRNLNEIFPVQQWLELYALHKWQGFVFVPDGLEAKLAPIVTSVLKQEFNLDVKDEAFEACHLPKPR